MKHILVFILSLSSYLAFSQGEANNWYFGTNGGITFNSGEPVNISSPSIQIDTYEGCSSISDADGNLLFYSDGSKVWDASHSVMPSGNNLLGHPSSTQSAMIIPKPKSTSIYYIFTVGSRYEDGTPGFNYYTIDMDANNGKGDVIAGPVNLSGALSLNWSEKVAAVQGGECHTYWVVSYDGANLKSYKVDENGVNSSPVISPAPSPENDIRGYLKISPNGKKIAIAHFVFKTQLLTEPVQGGDSSLILYDFNDITGQITNEVRLFDDPNDRIHPYGVEFSRQSTKIYTSAMIEQIVASDKLYNVVYQYDLESDDIPASEIEIQNQIGFRGALQLGPNGKIYATVPIAYQFGTKYLDVINNPEELGASADYQQDAINLGLGMATQGLPPFIASIFSPIEISTNDTNGDPISLNGQLIDLCSGDNLTITPEPITGDVNYEWTFNGSFYSDTENLELTNIDPTFIGDYKLEVSSFDECDRVSYRQAYFSIESVSPPPIANPVINSPICDDDYTGTYEMNFEDLFTQTILNGQDASIFEVDYFSNESDAINNTSPLPATYNSPNTTIYARIQNRNNTKCFDITSFEVSIYQSALPTEPDNIDSIVLCDDSSDGSDTNGFAVFDLESRKTELLKGQSDVDFTLTYFTDSNYLDSSKIADPNLFTNTISGGQTIYVRKTNNLEVNCYTDSSFEIVVNQLPEINSQLLLKNCDEDELPKDGYTDFNLEEANDYITNKNTDLEVRYYLSNADLVNSIEIPNPTQFNNFTQSQVLALVENNNGCYRIATIDLQTSTTSFEDSDVIELETCDDDDILDGLHLFNLTNASSSILSNFPSDQNLTVSFYKNQEDAQLEQNEINSLDDYMSETPFYQVIYGRVESLDNGACFGIGPYVSLTVHPRPEFEIEPNASVCVNLGPTTLATFNPQGNYTYQWFNSNNELIGSTPAIEVNNGGNYTVIATSGLNCASFSQIISVVESNVSTITSDDISITDDSINNTISINNTSQNLGIGDYEFSLNDEFGIFQDEPLFEQVAPGIHTIYVRDKNNCGIASVEVSVIGFPKFFTPNNDGQNDYWKVLGVNEYFYPTSLIHIYDRFGKLLARVNPLGNGWDGSYNGVELPADDYWFSVQLKDADGSIKNRRGHFSIIRR